MKAAIIGKKLGMTSYFTDDGIQIPCTVIEAGPCSVIQVKSLEKEGYNAVQVGFEEIEERKINKPLQGHFNKAGIKPRRHLKEFRDLQVKLEVGAVLDVEQFIKGDKVRVTSSKYAQGVKKTSLGSRYDNSRTIRQTKTSRFNSLIFLSFKSFKRIENIEDWVENSNC